MTPTDIQIRKSEKVIRIKWENGEERLYSFSALRSQCPCAECQSERQKKQDRTQLQIPLRLADWDQLDRVELVGNYALQIYWKDGHHHGIYSWESLYEIPSRPSTEEA